MPEPGARRRNGGAEGGKHSRSIHAGRPEDLRSEFELRDGKVIAMDAFLERRTHDKPPAVERFDGSAETRFIPLSGRNRTLDCRKVRAIDIVEKDTPESHTVDQVVGRPNQHTRWA